MSSSKDNREVVTGTIKYNELEGGFYGIISEDGNRYDPINLPQEFHIDGLRVRVEVEVKKDFDSIHMWGIPVKTFTIEEISDK